jgi:hypothetical protein
MLDNLNSISVLINTLFLGVGGVAVWFYTFKYRIRSERSSAKKESKVNDVEGDNAIIEQIDILLKKIATMTEYTLKIQEENAAIKEYNLSNKSAIISASNRITELCEMLNKSSEDVKQGILDALDNLKNKTK